MNKKTIAAILAIITILVMLTAFLTYELTRQRNLTFSGEGNLGISGARMPFEGHTKITITKAGETVLSEYHAGVVTNLGLNLTFCKLLGNSTYYNTTQYDYNVSYVGIGNQGSLSAASVVLPGEWNRTIADTQHDLDYNTANWTLVIYPDSGPYTADCLGLYYHSAEDTLFFYDTFSEVSGIDDTFTITLEIIISATGS